MTENKTIKTMQADLKQVKTILCASEFCHGFSCKYCPFDLINGGCVMGDIEVALRNVIKRLEKKLCPKCGAVIEDE